MGRLRRILAVPMALTAVWLTWILWRQAGPWGLAAAVAMVFLLAAGGRLVGSRQRRGVAVRKQVTALSLAFVCVLLLFSSMPMRSMEAPESARGEHVAFSEAELSRLVSEGTPVLLDFTADWCLTCKVNERVALDTDEVRSALDDAGIVVMTGDWTDGDPDITRFLEKNGRNSIPFYVMYDGRGGARVLPQILTPSIMASEVRRVSSSSPR